MKFSRAVDYAIRATLQLAHQDANTPIPCRKLALAGEMPERFLLQILRTLVLEDVLISTRGVDGGYQLKQPPSETPLLQVIEAIEGRLDTAGFSTNGLTDQTIQRLQQELQLVVDEHRQRLDGIKLSALVASD